MGIESFGLSKNRREREMKNKKKMAAYIAKIKKMAAKLQKI
jgi:hypothetical protein